MSRKPIKPVGPIGRTVQSSAKPDTAATADSDGERTVAPAIAGNAGVVGAEPDTSGPGDGEPKRRGRRPGSKNTAKALDVSGIESTLLSMHMLLAGLFDVKEIELEPSQANALATAMDKVSQHYNYLKATGKTWDLINLFAVLIFIYKPRVDAVRDARNAKRAKNISPIAPYIVPGGNGARPPQQARPSAASTAGGPVLPDLDVPGTFGPGGFKP